MGSVRNTAELEQQKQELNSQLSQLRETGAKRRETAGVLATLGIVSGGVAVLCYFLTTNALSSLQSASSASDASSHLSDLKLDGGLFLGSAVTGAVMLATGVGLLASIPSTTEIDRKIKVLDAEIRSAAAQ